MAISICCVDAVRGLLRICFRVLAGCGCAITEGSRSSCEEEGFDSTGVAAAQDTAADQLVSAGPNDIDTGLSSDQEASAICRQLCLHLVNFESLLHMCQSSTGERSIGGCSVIGSGRSIGLY